MREGWYQDNYLVLFQGQATSLERAYGLDDALPGYHLVGLSGWDDFIVEDARGPAHPEFRREDRPWDGGARWESLAEVDPDVYWMLVKGWSYEEWLQQHVMTKREGRPVQSLAPVA